METEIDMQSRLKSLETEVDELWDVLFQLAVALGSQGLGEAEAVLSSAFNHRPMGRHSPSADD